MSTRSEPDESDEQCPLSPWSEWTPCEKSCGPEDQIRNRSFRPKKKRRECRQLYPNLVLTETLPCNNPPCEGDEEDTTVSEDGDEAASAEETTVQPLEQEEDEEEEEGEDLVGAEDRPKVTRERLGRRRKVRPSTAPLRVCAITLEP